MHTYMFKDTNLVCKGAIIHVLLLEKSSFKHLIFTFKCHVLHIHRCEAICKLSKMLLH